MTEKLISFETAKLAKEKGFKYNSTCYDGSGAIMENINNHTNNNMQRFRYEAPTQSLLQKWLREEYNEHVGVTYMVGDRTYSSSLTLRSMGWSGFKTYEEALEKGLQEALKLI